MEINNTSMSELIASFPVDESSLIPLLQEAQDEHGYLTDEVVDEIADYLGLTASQVFGVASFYSQFRFTEPARHSICVCLGTACHVSGGETLVEAFERDLDVTPGNSTDDKRFDLDRVACLGCCALAPVVKIDDDIYSKVGVTKLKDIWSSYE